MRLELLGSEHVGTLKVQNRLKQYKGRIES